MADTAPAPPRRSMLPWAAASLLLVFAAGMIANPWFEQAVRGRLPFATAEPAPDMAAQTARLAARLAVLERRAPPAVAAERLARTEARVESSTDQLQRDAERIDRLAAEIAALGARLAVEEARETDVIAVARGAAERAEALLTVLLLRRAIDEGRPLDALMPATRRLFGTDHGEEVEALAALAAAPATRSALQADLDVLADATRPQRNWLQTMSVQVNRLLSGQGDDGPVARARMAALRGDLAEAAATLRAAPQWRRAPGVPEWLAAAERLNRAQTALAALEAAAAAPPAAAEAPPAPSRRPR
jgi:hypothetical protein